ncbi:MAG: SDR family oxidoreductase [Spirochaetales bacterium]|nr:SDR family oxidoreductase [Spirochaetales bacterium]
MKKLLLQKKAVIVGGAGRIGSAITRAFLLHGAQVLLVDRDEESLRRISEDLPAGERARCHPCRLEMDHENSVDELARVVEEKLVWTDILVNCLGYIYRAPFTIHSMAELNKLMKLNFSINFAVCQKIASMMVERGSGKIINLASVGGFRPEKEHSGYCAAKAALIALSKVMALELSPKNIQVNIVAPGPTETVPFSSPYYTEHPEALQAIETVTGRIGHPEDHTGLLVFLASDQSDWITGQVIASDGGWALV